MVTNKKGLEEEWILLRTVNIIERLNKESKRRTKPMKIVAGENSCYRLLAFILLKMELAWRTTPVGKVNANLPFFKLNRQKRIYTKFLAVPNPLLLALKQP